MAGITLTGFTIKSAEEIKEELETALKASFGESIDVSPQSNFGQIIGVMTERYAELWETAQDVYAAFTPDQATGASLDNVCAITGTTREPSVASTVSAICTGTNGTVIPVASIASVEDTLVRFETSANGTLATATAWAPTTAYVVGDIRRNGATQRIYRCITAGTSAGSGGPDDESDDITDGTVHWEYCGDGAAYASIEFASSKAGAYVARAGTLNTIETPVSGWEGVRNPLDATVGRSTEEDPALRLRREEELRIGGRASPEAMRQALLAVGEVTSATIFENTTNATDVDGLPAHTFEALVQGGEAQDIIDCIWENKPAGIGSYGTSSGTATDSQGFTHTIYYSRPTEINIYVRLDITVDANAFPLDGEAQIKEAIVDWGDVQACGKDAVASAMIARAFSVDGVLDVTVAYVGSVNPPLSSSVSISTRQLAVYDTSRITINKSTGTP